MMIEAIIDVFFGFLTGLLSVLQIVELPFDAVGVLRTFTLYGSYIVGADIMLLFSSLVFMWTAAKLSVGIGIRLWELLPFT